MRIGFLIDDTLDSTAGVQQFTLTLGRELSERGHHVFYLTSQASDSHPENEQIRSLSKIVKVKINGNRVGTPLPAKSSRIKSILSELDLDVIHVTTPYSPFLAGRVISRANAAVVGTFHIAVDTKIASIGAKLLAKMQFRTLKKVNYWTAVSDAADNFAREHYNISPDKITPNPIKLSKFRTKTPTKPMRIVFLGRLVERKGAQHLLQAVKQLDDDLKAQLDVIIGGSGPLLDSLKSSIRGTTLESRVSFPGFVPEHKKAELLASASIAAFPSDGGECFGISVIEGMAVNDTAVIAGDNQGYRTILKDRPVMMVDPHDSTAFASKLKKLLSDKKFRDETIEWQKTSVKQYDVSKSADSFEQIYKLAIDRNSRS